MKLTRPPRANERAQGSRGSAQVRLIPNPMSDTSGGPRGPPAGVRTRIGVGMPKAPATLSARPETVKCAGSRKTATQFAWSMAHPVGAATLRPED